MQPGVPPMSLRRRITALLLAIAITASVIRFFPEAKAKADDGSTSFDGFFDPDFDQDLAEMQGGAEAEDEPAEPQNNGSEDENKSADAAEDVPAAEMLCENGIRLYHFMQLSAIGSDAVVTDADFSEDTFGTGEPVVYADGSPAVYSSIASYYIVNDILLPNGGVFDLPSDFSGTISGLPNDEQIVYDAETDTVYIGCIYQLSILVSEERETTPVISGDLCPDTFGVGSFIFPDGESGSFLTYSAAHNYMLSSQFTTAIGRSPALQQSTVPGKSDVEKTQVNPEPARTASADHIDGRDYFGQVSVELSGTTYILIGDRQQLDAINSDATIRTNVCGPVFKVAEGTVEVWRTNLHLAGDWIWLSEFDGSKELKDGNGYGTTADEVMASYQALASSGQIVYPGDADLIDLGTDGDFKDSPLYDVNSSGYHGLDRPGGTATSGSQTRDIYFTYNASGDPDLSTATLIESAPTVGTLRYEKDGKYIVFRDINMNNGALNGTSWKPLMFTGEMYGVKTENSSDISTLWNAGKTQMNLNTELKPEIYNLDVNAVAQSSDPTKLDLDVHAGVGFFGTLTGSGSGSRTEDPNDPDKEIYDLVGNVCIVRNIRLKDGTVTNNLTAAKQSQTVVNAITSLLGGVLEAVLTPLLRALTGKDDIGVSALTDALNARVADPSNLATGAFAGRVMGNVLIADCEVQNIAVSSVLTDAENPEAAVLGSTQPKIVGTGGFVGYTEGATSYEGISKVLGTLVDALSDLLNIIPGLGLGDLVTLLLHRLLPVGQLIPTGYTTPEFRRCTVDNCTLNVADGKYGVGGFAGSLAGVIATDCKVKNCEMTVKADHFGGGFAGVARDGIIKATLSGLGIDVASLIHPQTELVRCSIENSDITVTGGTFLGGFTGVLANSYGINDTVDADSTLIVSGTGDYIGGFTGHATLGSIFDLADYVEDGSSLLTVVKQAATALLGNSEGESLLDLGGVAAASILGFENDAPTTVESTGGNFVGGVVGKGEGTIIARSDETHIRKLSKYKRQHLDGTYYVTDLPIASNEARDNHVTQLISVSAGKNYAGGIAGHISTASVGGLLGSTLGIGQFIGFEVSKTYIDGIITDTGADTPGYTVTTGTNVGDGPEHGDYAGGAFGYATGGDVEDVALTKLASVSGNNRIGGFVGATGPGNLASNDGVNLQLLGISLLSANNLLQLISGQRTTYLRADVTGISSGYTVEETGLIEDNATDMSYSAGGFAGEANSVRFVDCHSANLLSVTANLHDGNAGGFVALSAAGSVADAVEHMDTDNLANLLSLNQLLDAVPMLVPSYDGCDVTYVDGGFVKGDTAGGFAGDFRSGKVNTYTMEETEISGNTYIGVNPIDDPNTPYTYACGTGVYDTQNELQSGVPYSVNNIHHVRGGNYAGGWGGHVYPGALASAAGGLGILGAANTSAISATDLLGVADVYIPIIKYAGVNSPNGFTVYAAHDYGAANQPAAAGYAGGFIGCGQSVQISYSDVNKLAHREVTEPDAFTADDNSAYERIGIFPDELESQDGGNYIDYASNDPDAIPYSVAGAYYAGGYIGHMDIGSAASVGDKLSLLGNNISLTNVLGVLGVVVSTIEHSDVYGMPGGFNVLASTHINLHDGSYDENGVAYAGGFAGKISGGHIQESNCENFAYIIGEIAAGGYVGEMIPGEVAKVLPQSDLSILGDVSGLASLAEDFVPTIRNSETTCIPCGGAIRAESASDRTTLRGMAGGYVGHTVGGQIWGNSNDVWKSENDGYNAVTEEYTDNKTIGHYTGKQRLCSAIRIRSVYGAEYAGGYCGFMEAGSTADVGSLSLLGGLLSIDNLLGTLNATYATIKRGTVTGPLRGVDETTWNAWKTYVGSTGQFSSELLNADYSELDRFIYGTHIVAGRHKFSNYPNTFLSGCAGGFVGSMHSGVIEHCINYDTKLVLGMRASGGFAGEMQTGDLASAGGISLLGLDLNLGSLAPNIGSVLVPAIKDCEAIGYRYGLQVGATGSIGNQTLAGEDPNDVAFGNPNEAGVGNAGGFVGAAYGGQLEATAVRLLKRVKGTNAIGGYAGCAAAAALVSADTNNASNGILQKLLNDVLNSQGGLLDALHATVCTINDATVTSVDDTWGFVVDGEYTDHGTKYAPYAGGFAGHLQATLINTKKGSLEGEVFTPDTEAGTTTVTVSKLRGVNGGHYAGGFVGLASVGSVAQLGGSSTNVLSLLNLGNIGLLDVFRTYIYRADVHGVDEGVRIYAHDWEQPNGNLQGTNVTGAAGGFAGGLMSGTIEDSSIDYLSYVEAPNYAGGFAGHSGTKAVLDLSGASVDTDSVLGKLLAVLGLDLSASLQLLNIIGSTFERDTVSGYGGASEGYIVKTTVTQTPALLGVEERFISGSCAAGFIGFAEIAQIGDRDVGDGVDCQALKLKKVISPQIAGGFVGRTSVAYLAELDASSDLVGALTWLVRLLLGVLGIGALEGSNLIDLYSDILGIQVAADGYLVRLNLFGLVIGISAVSYDPETDKPTAVTVVLGSSIITLPIGPDGEIDTTNLTVELIELNRTAIRDGYVLGVSKGYDVLGGGATYNRDGSDSLGYAGGFIGLNDHGFVSHSVSELCDTVRGTSGKTGPFVGGTLFNENAQKPDRLEGSDNFYYVYRKDGAGYTAAAKDGAVFSDSTDSVSVSGTSYNRYQVRHIVVDESTTPHTYTARDLAFLAGAEETGSGEPRDLKAYYSMAKYVGMNDTPLGDNPAGTTPAPAEMKDPCEEEPIEITVNKIWHDNDDEQGLRPDHVTVTVAIVNVGTNVPDRLVKAGRPASGADVVWSKTYTIDVDDASAFTDVWSITIDDLPYGSVQDGTYYQFYVYETVPSYYRSSYSVDGDSAAVTVVNTMTKLPDTGGAGTNGLRIAGVTLLLLGAALAICMAYRKKERRVNSGRKA